MYGCHVGGGLLEVYLVNRLFKIFFSVEGEDFTIVPPDVFEVIFPPGTVDGTTMCDPCSIINDDNLEGSIRYTASSSDRHCCNLDSINSTCTY